LVTNKLKKQLNLSDSPL